MSVAQILCIAAVAASALASVYCLFRSLAADIRARQRRDATRLSNRDMPPPRRLGAFAGLGHKAQEWLAFEGEAAAMLALGPVFAALAFAAALLFAHLG